MTFLDQFNGDIAQHQMKIIRDDGVVRHIRFKRPETTCMHFDLLTWPGYLCYTGDMGTYVFRRLEDMFKFFRRSPTSEPYSIDFRYWAEKLEAVDRCDGVCEWSLEAFRANVRDYVEQHTGDDEDWSDERKLALRQEVEERVCAAADNSEHHAWTALHNFEHDGFSFRDWERNCEIWTRRFLWCCHALEWAISTYDVAKNTKLLGAEA